MTDDELDVLIEKHNLGFERAQKGIKIRDDICLLEGLSVKGHDVSVGDVWLNVSPEPILASPLVPGDIEDTTYILDRGKLKDGFAEVINRLYQEKIAELKKEFADL